MMLLILKKLVSCVPVQETLPTKKAVLLWTAFGVSFRVMLTFALSPRSLSSRVYATNPQNKDQAKKQDD